MSVGFCIKKIQQALSALLAACCGLATGAKSAMALSRTLRKRCQALCCAVSWPPRFVAHEALAVHAT